MKSSERESWRMILGDKGIFENFRMPHRRNISLIDNSKVEAISYLLITLLFIIAYGIVSGRQLAHICMLFWGIVIFPGGEMLLYYFRNSWQRSLTAGISVLHMILFIEILFTLGIWSHESKIVFVSIMSNLRMVLSGEMVFPITICTVGIMQCWVHGEVSTLTTLFPYAFLFLTMITFLKSEIPKKRWVGYFSGNKKNPAGIRDNTWRALSRSR